MSRRQPYKNKIRARIGMVNFINTAPLYEVWQQTVQRSDWQVVEGPPATLNQKLFSDRLDLGFISSHEYGLHPDKYKILSDLSISAAGPVGSVLLFSRCAFGALHEKKVLLTAQSQTSISLVKIVLEEFYGVKPEYTIGSVYEHDLANEEIAAVLVIGDEALRMAQENEYDYRMDLAEIWQEHTGLPFVFAVWAVREAFCKSDPDTVREIHHELVRCINEGKIKLKEISRKVAPRIPIDPEDCYKYLLGLEYDLNAQKQEAIALFFEYLIKRGEITPLALPFKICG